MNARGKLVWVVMGAVLGIAVGAAGQTVQKVGSVEYRKLETREATEARMVQLLNPSAARWGTWHMLTPFPHDQRRGPKLADAQGPEDELPKMKANGPGPDLKREFTGKKGVKAVWRGVGDIANRAVDFRIFEDKQLIEDASGYLYGTVEVEKAMTVDLTMGSDDGLRFWLNGRLLVDKDVLRGLDAEEDKVRLDLQPGVNHVLVKVSQVKGGFEYQINCKTPMDPFQETQLQYLLDRDFPRNEEDRYYRALTIATPADVVLEAGGMDVMPPNEKGECRPIVCTRRGDVYIVEGAYDDPPFAARFKKFASGLHEPLGLAVRIEGGKTVVYCTQRGEITRLVDEDGDDVADVYQTFADGWGVSGNYHEFAFGPKFDREGNAWVTLNIGFCGGLGKSVAPLRGWALKFAPDGTMTKVCDGLRSPNGIGEFTDGAMFYLDNQGDYVGTNRMTHLAPGSFAGHPAGLGWRDNWKQGDPMPPIQPATIWFPYRKMGQSTADFLLYDTEGRQVLAPVNESLKAGKFGPFAGQVFCGDQTLCLVTRVFIEKVDGVYQGACFPFRSGLDSGVNRLCWAGDGSMFIGQTDRGWGSTGRLRQGLQRLVWTGEVPFEVLTMKITGDGFLLEFTKELDEAAAADPASYAMISYTYEHHPEYGSDEMEKARQTVAGVEVVDARTVRLKVDSLRSGGMGYVHELTMPGVRAKDGRKLLHEAAYYTVQRVPGRAQAGSP
jgi:hypothetical protein